MQKKLLLAPLALIVAATSSVAVADEKALQNALGKAQFMLRQASAEKQEVEQQLSALKQEYDEFRKKAESKLAAREARSDKLSKSLGVYEVEYDALRNKYVELVKLYKDEQKTAIDLGGKLEQQVAQYEQCRVDNLKLFDVNQEILGKYEGKGMWDVIASREPITGIKKVAIENIVQEYQFKNEDLLNQEPAVAVVPEAD